MIKVNYLPQAPLLLHSNYVTKQRHRVAVWCHCSIILTSEIPPEYTATPGSFKRQISVRVKGVVYDPHLPRVGSYSPINLLVMKRTARAGGNQKAVKGTY